MRRAIQFLMIGLFLLFTTVSSLASGAPIKSLNDGIAIDTQHDGGNNQSFPAVLDATKGAQSAPDKIVYPKAAEDSSHEGMGTIVGIGPKGPEDIAPEWARKGFQHPGDSQKSDPPQKLASNQDKGDTANQKWDAPFILNLCKILGVGICVVLITILVLTLKSVPARSVLQLVGFPMIAFLAVFLIVVGYSQEQIAPAYSILGAIAGWLMHGDKADGSSHYTK